MILTPFGCPESIRLLKGLWSLSKSIYIFCTCTKCWGKQLEVETKEGILSNLVNSVKGKNQNKW